MLSVSRTELPVMGVWVEPSTCSNSSSVLPCRPRDPAMCLRIALYSWS